MICSDLNLPLSSLLLVHAVGVLIEIVRHELTGILFGRKYSLANVTLSGFINFENIFVFTSLKEERFTWKRNYN